jgi:hypothetical protein
MERNSPVAIGADPEEATTGCSSAGRPGRAIRACTKAAKDEVHRRRHESNDRRQDGQIEPSRNQHGGFGVQATMDEIERAAIRDEGYDPDNPALSARNFPQDQRRPQRFRRVWSSGWRARGPG